MAIKHQPIPNKEFFGKIDEVYEAINPIGCAQTIYFLCLGWLSLIGRYNFVQGVFLHLVPEFTCLDDTVCENATRKELCQLNRSDWEWVNPDRTFVSHFGLECTMDKAFLASSLFFIPGCVIGLLIGGQLADRFGRRKIILIGLSMCICCQFGLAFAQSYTMYITIRILAGITFMMFQCPSLIFINELFPGKTRPLLCIVRSILGSMGLIIQAGVYYYLPVWNSIYLGSAALMISGLICIILPESPHWLLVNRGPEEATEVLRKMARWNGRSEMGDKIKLDTPATMKEGGNVVSLLRSKEYSFTTLRLFYQWFLVSLLNYSFLYSVDKVAGDFLVNFMIMSVVSIPFGIFTSMIMRFVGRKKALYINLSIIIIACAFCMGNFNLGGGWTTERFAVVIATKWGVGCQWMVVTLLTNESLPTSIRATVQSTGSMVARIGVFLAPFVVKLMAISPYLMYGLFIGLTLLGMLTGWWLPETKDKNLKETIATKELKETMETRDKMELKKY